MRGNLESRRVKCTSVCYTVTNSSFTMQIVVTWARFFYQEPKKVLDQNRSEALDMFAECIGTQYQLSQQRSDSNQEGIV